MSFSNVYGSLLSPFIQKYKDAKNEKGRRAVVANAADATRKSRDLLEDKGVDLPKDLQRAITRYIKGFIKKEEETSSVSESQDPKPKKIKQVYTIRDVIKQNYRALIEAEIPYTSNDKAYIGSYQSAVSTVHRKMTDSDLEEAEEIVDLWNKQGAPTEVQLKRAKTKLPKDIKQKVDEWKFGSGALVMCLVAYSDGQDVHAFHVESSPVIGNSFTNTCSDWRDGTFENFKDWAVRQFGVKDLESDDEAEVPVHMQKAKDINFERNRSGEFILPHMSDYRTIRERQRVIRGYIGATYREFTGSSRSAFPYGLASKDGQEIFSTDSVPDGFCLSDPDHLNASAINNLYAHWLKRQDEGLAPFIILNPSPLHERALKKPQKVKERKKMAYVEVDSDEQDEEQNDEKDEKEEEDLEETEGAGKHGDDDRMPSSIKYGPPIGKPKKKVIFSKDPTPVAGPSTLPPLKHASKKKKIPETSLKLSNVPKSKTVPDGRQLEVNWKNNTKKTKSRNSADTATLALEDSDTTGNSLKKTNSKKRKMEEDMTEGTSQKFTKTDHFKKLGRSDGEEPVNKPMGTKLSNPGRQTKTDLSGIKRGMKREHVEEPELTAESSRNFKRLKSVALEKEKDPVSSLPAQGRVREASRVKEFPAGNIATSASRIAFLNSLCGLPKFRALLDLVQQVPKASPIPKNYPSWASWNSREVYLPAKFHSATSFKEVLSILRTALGNSEGLEGGRIDAPLLLLGLVYREVSRSMEIEPGTASNIPLHLANSPLGIKEVKKIERLLDDVCIPG